MSKQMERLRLIVRTMDTEKVLAAAIAHNIKQARREAGLTQADLARITDKRQPHIARLERQSYGRHTIHSLNQLAVAMNTTVSDLTKINNRETPHD